MRYCYCEAKVRSSSVSTFAHNIFEGSPSKRGSMEPIEPPLDPPLMCVVLATGCFNTGSVLLEGWGQHSPHAVLTQQA